MISQHEKVVNAIVNMILKPHDPPNVISIGHFFFNLCFHWHKHMSGSNIVYKLNEYYKSSETMVLTPYDKLIVVSNGSGFHIPVPTQSLVMTENTFPKYMFFMFSKKYTLTVNKVSI